MKVGMLTSVAERCGICVYSADLADGLRKLVDLEVVPVWDRVSPWETYLSDSADRLNARDVVHVQHEYSFWGSVLPGQNKFFEQMASIRKPIVFTVHTLDPAAQVLGLGLPGSPIRKVVKRILAAFPPYRKVIERRTFEVADRIVVHDSEKASRLKGRGIPESRIRVIPMGVPPPSPDPALGDEFRREFGLEGRTLLVVFGFVRPGRGYETVLDALPMLSQPATLVIAGGPQTGAQAVYADSLAQRASSLGLADRVVITGYLPDEKIAGALRAADIILLPQMLGTGSYTIQVAFGYGKPMIASDLPCFVDPEQSHGCPLTFARGDARDLAAKLNSVLEDEALRSRLSRSALEYAAEHSWDKVAEKTVEVYRELA